MELDNIIRKLAAQLSKILQEQGGVRYELHYTGAGDSTDGCEAIVEPVELTQAFDQIRLEYTATTSHWESNTGAWVQMDEPAVRNFEDAAYTLAEYLWDHAGQAGWYNNEGGYGDLTLLPGGFVEFRHVNYLNESYDDEENGVDDSDREVSVMCHWRFNVLVGPIDAPYEETTPEVTPP